MSIACYSLLDYIKMHRGEDCCWDCPDTVFDIVVTVDCSVDCDGKIDIAEDEDKKYPHMSLFIKEFLSKVEVVKLMKWGTPIIDVTGLIHRNMTLVRQWIKEHWRGKWDNDDDITYRMIEEIHYAIAGYKGEKGYTAYYDLFRQFFRTNQDAAGVVHEGVKFNAEGEEVANDK